MSEPRRWMDYGTSGVMPPVEVVAAADYDALRARVADGDVVRGDLQTVADVLRDYEGETVWQQAQAAVARVAELEAAVTRYRQYEYVEAQHDETGRSWFGARYNIPTRFHEVSNESGEPGPTARAAGNKSEVQK